MKDRQFTRQLETFTELVSETIRKSRYYTDYLADHRNIPRQEKEVTTFTKENCRPFNFDKAVNQFQAYGKFVDGSPVKGSILLSQVPGRKPLLVSFNGDQSVDHYTKDGFFTLYREDERDLFMFPLGLSKDGKWMFPGDDMYYLNGERVDVPIPPCNIRTYYATPPLQKKAPDWVGLPWPDDGQVAFLMSTINVSSESYEYKEIIKDAVQRGIVQWKEAK